MTPREVIEALRLLLDIIKQENGLSAESMAIIMAAKNKIPYLIQLL